MQPLRGSPYPRQQFGAALLLLLLVLGLSVAALLLHTPARQGSAQDQTLQALAAARSALLGYAQLNGRLPSPAASPFDGQESPALCQLGASCSGYLPWITLGIPGSDSWGKRLRYSVSPQLTHAPILRLQTLADRRILTRTASGALAYQAGQAECSVDMPCVAAVLLSSGLNNFGTSLAGIRQANGSVSNVDEQWNDRATRDFISRPLTRSSAVAGGEFDDLVTWIPLPMLYQNINAAGKLP